MNFEKQFKQILIEQDEKVNFNDIVDLSFYFKNAFFEAFKGVWMVDSELSVKEQINDEEDLILFFELLKNDKKLNVEKIDYLYNNWSIDGVLDLSDITMPVWVNLRQKDLYNKYDIDYDNLKDWIEEKVLFKKPSEILSEKHAQELLEQMKDWFVENIL